MQSDVLAVIASGTLHFVALYVLLGISRHETGRNGIYPSKKRYAEYCERLVEKGRM
jgi:hypothetical protein